MNKEDMFFNNQLVKIATNTQITRATNEVERQMRSLKNTLENELRNLENCKEKGIEYNPSEMGIVQSGGLYIDLACARLSVLLSLKSEGRIEELPTEFDNEV